MRRRRFAEEGCWIHEMQPYHSSLLERWRLPFRHRQIQVAHLALKEVQNLEIVMGTVEVLVVLQVNLVVRREELHWISSPLTGHCLPISTLRMSRTFWWLLKS